ncbi:MAG: XDD3 domain-containing surface protein [Leptolyngbyaceae cyanobacterium bins.59]|nr:XDD3 domain-containing surface protein [Leptolyngbyaceae cyanobacterium bins.59]
MFSKVSFVTALTGAVLFLPQLPASAQFHQGWHYTLDAGNDSLALGPDRRRVAGGTIYEIYGMAFKEDFATESIWFAFSANLPPFGHTIPINPATGRPQLCPAGDPSCYDVVDGNVGWGDLFLDFSGRGNLKAASDAGQLMGIRFALNNDSGVNSLGIYDNVRIASVTRENAGYSNLANHNNMLRSVASGRTAGMGDLAWNSSYFSPYTTPGGYSDPASLMPNVIASGNKIGEVALQSQENLVRAGLDTNFFNAGSEAKVFGFRIPKALLPVGQFIATLITECVNDAIAMVNQVRESPPLPILPYVCPVTDGQRNALLPTRIVDGVKIFEDVPSGRWYDPPASMGFEFVTIGDTLFTSISGFPCVVSPSEPTPPFTVRIKNEQGTYQSIGEFSASDTIDFKLLNEGGGVREFQIVGIRPEDWPTGWEKLPFSLPIGFGAPVGSFTMTPITCSEDGVCIKTVPEPSIMAGLGLLAIGLWKTPRSRKKDD